MKTNVILALDTRVKKADGSFPLVLRIVHNRSSSQVPTGISLKEKDWDAKARAVKASYRGTESVARLNNILAKRKREAMDAVLALHDKGQLAAMTVLQLRDALGRRTDRLSFFAFGHLLVESLKEAKRFGNARAYSGVLGTMKNYVGRRDLAFQDITYAFLKKWEGDHLAAGNGYNGFAVYMRTVRAIFNIAMKEGKVDKDLYPFSTFRIKTTKTRKRAISLEAIRAIESLDISSDDSLFHSRNYFMASFYMRGMSFFDLAQLKLENIVDGRIQYDRRKTHKPYSVKLTAELEAMMQPYVENKKKTDYIFPIIKREDEQEQYRDVEWARKRFNRDLKELAQMAGISENLTSYVTRHSFATRAKNLGIPIASISDMLGHGSVKTTEVYLSDLSSEALDQLHHQIIR